MKVLFAYEEAIGFQVGDWNFDKDGISALMTFYALLKDCRGVPLTQRLHRIYEAEGVWPVQYNGYYVCKPASRLKSILRSVRKPAALDCVFSNDGHVISVEFPSQGAWLMLRSSGTEPKLKYYSEMLRGRESSESSEGKGQREFEEMMSGVIKGLIGESIEM